MGHGGELDMYQTPSTDGTQRITTLALTLPWSVPSHSTAAMERSVAMGASGTALAAQSEAAQRMTERIRTC